MAFDNHTMYVHESAGEHEQHTPTGILRRRKQGWVGRGGGVEIFKKNILYGTNKIFVCVYCKFCKVQFYKSFSSLFVKCLLVVE